MFLFNDVDEYDEKSWNKVMTKEGVGEILDRSRLVLSELGDWSTGSIEVALRSMIEGMAIGVGKALQPLRVAVTGSSVSPPLFESLAAVGREVSLARIGRARDLVS
jgi:glutamyl-tRNA synthetase